MVRSDPASSEVQMWRSSDQQGGRLGLSLSAPTRACLYFEVWVLSAAHCFCNERINLRCERYNTKDGVSRWRTDYNTSDFRNIEVSFLIRVIHSYWSRSPDTVLALIG